MYLLCDASLGGEEGAAPHREVKQQRQLGHYQRCNAHVQVTACRHLPINNLKRSPIPISSIQRGVGIRFPVYLMPGICWAV